MVERSLFASAAPAQVSGSPREHRGAKAAKVILSLQLYDGGVGMHGRTQTAVINEEFSLLRTDTISTGAAGLGLANGGRTN